MRQNFETIQERAQRSISIDESDRTLCELATGRFYFDGEPEVRLRSDVLSEPSVFLLVTTVMGDGDEPVGLTTSLFQSDASGGHKRLEEAAKDDVASRVEMSRGKVLSQQ